MAFVEDRPDVQDEAPPVKQATDARQADGHRENLRVLDTALPMAIFALAILVIYFAAAAGA